ncbi:hypothetical protein SDC9_120081 [bioreactor metagenome]|uniref:Uncharacterized protein n=1 Tax=bioreactor metagenome TaxID=1076179 RepID=A0A645C6B5_9ZZZZ
MAIVAKPVIHALEHVVILFFHNPYMFLVIQIEAGYYFVGVLVWNGVSGSVYDKNISCSVHQAFPMVLFLRWCNLDVAFLMFGKAVKEVKVESHVVSLAELNASVNIYHCT